MASQPASGRRHLHYLEEDFPSPGARHGQRSEMDAQIGVRLIAHPETCGVETHRALRKFLLARGLHAWLG